MIYDVNIFLYKKSFKNSVMGFKQWKLDYMYFI